MEHCLLSLLRQATVFTTIVGALDNFVAKMRRKVHGSDGFSCALRSEAQERKHFGKIYQAFCLPTFGSS